MDWKEITIDDQDLFDRFFAQSPCEASDYTFTNLFIWHFSRRIQFAVEGEFIFIRVQYPNQTPLALMPSGSGPLESAFQMLVEDFQRRNLPFRIRAVTRDRIDYLQRALPDVFIFTPEPDRFDYVYRALDLIRLEGNKYKPKRNHLNVFKQSYRYEYLPLTVDRLHEVTESEIEWCKKRDCKSVENLENEKKGILEALENFERLNFKGGLLKADGKVVAFTFGEPLTGDTVVIHIEKADPDVRGAYQMINQQFLENEFPRMTWVNREEDLGIEGLRKAKQSYYPAKMIEKNTCQLRRTSS